MTERQGEEAIDRLADKYSIVRIDKAWAGRKRRKSISHLLRRRVKAKK